MNLRTILVATDFSAPAQAAFDEATHLAAIAGARVVLAHVLAPPESGEEARHPELRRLAADRLEVSASVARKKIHSVEAVELVGDVAEEIVGLARGRAADLIVIGTHGRAGIERIVQGSVAEHVMRAAPCPLLSVRAEVVRPAGFEERHAHARVLAGVDLGPEAASVVRQAASFARQLGASLALVHATGPVDGLGRDGHDTWAYGQLERLAGLPRLEGLHVTCTVIGGSAADALIDAAKSLRAAWVVVGSHRRSGPSRWLLGSVAESMMRAAPCPVLVVRDLLAGAEDPISIAVHRAGLADEGETP